MPRPRRRAVGLLLGAGVLFFLGTNVQAGWLFVLAALLIGVVFAGCAMAARTVGGLEVERRFPAEVHQGEEALVHVAITNRSRSVRRGLVADDDHLGATAVFVGAIPPGERAEAITARVAERRGLHESEGVVLRSTAPFGVAERRRNFSATARTLVLPAVEPLGALPFVEPAATVEHAVHRSPRRGHGPEYLGIREYRPGDSMRHVHWPSTARHGAVMVREFEEERTPRLAIVVDASRDVGETWTPLDRACSAAASIALAAFAQGHGARLVTAERGEIEVLARVDEDELLARLALLGPDAGIAFPDLVRGLGPELRGVETVVLIFPAWREHGPDALASVVEAMTATIPRVVALPIEVDGDGRRGSRRREGSAALEAALRDAGAAVYPWRAGEDLTACIASGGVGISP